MPEGLLDLTVRTPTGVVIREQARGVVAEDDTGRFGARPGMERLVAVLVPGLLEYRDAAGVSRLVAVGAGLLHADSSSVMVAVRHATPCTSLARVREEVLRAVAQRRRGASAMSATLDALYKRLVVTIAEGERARS